MTASALFGRWHRSGLLMSVLTALLLSACSPPPELKLLRDTTHLGIVPAYRSFAQHSAQLDTRSRTFCAASENKEAQFLALREAWRRAASSWAALQSLQFGPVLVDNQAWKIQFWPDRKNLVARKVEALLKEESDLDLARVAEASVVVQGLSALEYLLFDEGAGQLHDTQGDEGLRRCQLLQATSAHLQGVASGLLKAWQPEGDDYTSRFTKPGPENRDYPDSQIAIGKLLDSLVYGVELVKRDKLERPLGLAGGSPQVYLLEWWRSRHSRQAIIATLNGLAQLYSGGGGFGLDDYLAESGNAELASQIEQQFSKTLALAQDIDGALFKVADEPATRQQAAALHEALVQLETLCKRQLPQALGISLGFNSSDGD